MTFAVSRAPRWSLLCALLLLDVLLLTPELPWAGFPTRHWIALEAPLIVGLMALLPSSPWRRWLCGIVALFALAIVVAAAGDALTQTMQGRSLNLYTDITLIPILIELIVANLGLTLAMAGLLVIGLALFGVGLTLARSLQGFDAGTVSRPLALGLILIGAGGLVGLAVADNDEAAGWTSRIGRPSVDFIAFEWQRAQATREAMASFGRQLYDDRRDASPGGQPLPGLAETNVILGFIESYGVAAIERAPFSHEIQPRLHAEQARLEAAGLSVVTGRVTAATLGGQSWLNHATFASGLPITSQLRFELMMGSPRATLIDDFNATGHETIAVMPGITRDWPEADRYAYDEVHTSRSMDYQGPPMGWASMPDQFTWQRVAEFSLAAHNTPTFTELATLSSHAPWSPVIDMIDDWATIGDGQVFDRWQGAGSDYSSLWNDADAMRRNYAPAIDYALQAASGFARRYLGRNLAHVDGDVNSVGAGNRTLMMILGDHQAAPAVIGDDPGQDVPLHVISDDPELLQGFLEHGFRPGMFPPGPKTAIPMQEMRALLHRIYGTGVNNDLSETSTMPASRSGS